MREMSSDLIRSSNQYSLNRRDFLWLSSICTAGFLAGCAVNPVTGASQFMLVSEETEIQIDRANSPHQFSADYGAVQDMTLNGYIQGIGRKIAAGTHRPHMPYQFQCVNATYVNAYAFPGGSIGITRGILLSLDNEAELAALLGHELGHVNARHTAEQMSKTMFTQAVVGSIGLFASSKGALSGQLASQLGMLGAGALLASYSRDNEREADALGMDYIVKTGYGVGGAIGLMDMLREMSTHKSQGTADLLFSTHPMSDERYQTAVSRAHVSYAAAEKLPLFKDRYMDHTAVLRAIGGAIKSMQLGDDAMKQKKYTEAENHFEKALSKAPADYTGLLMMAKCQLAQEKDASALIYAEKAKTAYPAEAQAHHLSGFAKVRTKKYEAALEDFQAYEKKLPGNPNTGFFTGYAFEGMGKREDAATEYRKYLKAISQGPQAEHAYRRLVEWGYVDQKASSSKQ